MKTGRLMLLAAGALFMPGRPAPAQQKLATGAQRPMPLSWIDESTGHRVVRLSRAPGANASFYFHNNPFVPGPDGDIMIFYNTGPSGRQLYAVNLRSLAATQLTSSPGPKSGEIVAPKSRQVFYQSGKKVYATNIDTRATRLIYTFPDSINAGITTLNADEAILAGSFAHPSKDEIYRRYPEKKDYFNRIFDAKIPHTLFTLNIKTGELKTIHQENTWLGHIQFSPVAPQLLMFCHEGPWHKVDRIWTIDIHTGAVKLMHRRSMENEIAGHEFFSRDGKTIWFDLQKPKGAAFFLAGADVQTGEEQVYRMDRNEWSIHFNISPDQRLFAGDGGDPGQVAKAPDGRWIYLFYPADGRLKAEKLVNMSQHNYRLEPNVHFSPDGKWVIFRANFEGESQVYAVELDRAG